MHPYVITDTETGNIVATFEDYNEAIRYMDDRSTRGLSLYADGKLIASQVARALSGYEIITGEIRRGVERNSIANEELFDYEPICNHEQKVHELEAIINRATVLVDEMVYTGVLNAGYLKDVLNGER